VDTIRAVESRDVSFPCSYFFIIPHFPRRFIEQNFGPHMLQ